MTETRTDPIDAGAVLAGLVNAPVEFHRILVERARPGGLDRPIYAIALWRAGLVEPIDLPAMLEWTLPRYYGPEFIESVGLLCEILGHEHGPVQAALERRELSDEVLRFGASVAQVCRLANDLLRDRDTAAVCPELVRSSEPTMSMP